MCINKGLDSIFNHLVSEFNLDCSWDLLDFNNCACADHSFLADIGLEMENFLSPWYRVGIQSKIGFKSAPIWSPTFTNTFPISSRRRIGVLSSPVWIHLYRVQKQLSHLNMVNEFLFFIKGERSYPMASLQLPSILYSLYNNELHKKLSLLSLFIAFFTDTFHEASRSNKKHPYSCFCCLNQGSFPEVCQ